MMKKLCCLVIFLFIVSFSYSQIATEGGNTTEMEIKILSNSTNWDGLYGNVLLGSGTTYNYTVTGSNITELNIMAQNPPCAYTSIRMHIIAVNSTNITLPLSIGNLARLDALIDSKENGSNTFMQISNFTLTYGTYINVPTTYTYVNNTSSTYFRMGYLNDADGNIVFITNVVNNQPGWNGTLNDYQIMLAKGINSMNYTLWADVNYTCPSPTEPTVSKKHKIEITELPSFSSIIGRPIKIPIIVRNVGDYPVEKDVKVYFDCIPHFNCTQTTIENLYRTQPEEIILTLTGHRIGTYTIIAYARNDFAMAYKEFQITITAECEKDEECAQTEYCSAGACKQKKKILEECKRNGECESNLCDNGVCVRCIKNNDCAFDETCIGGLCRKITCECGKIENHACILYECCKDGDCSKNENCVSNKCVQKEIEIKIVDGEFVEGKEVIIQILNNKWEPIPYADVFTSEMRTKADEKGFAKIIIPYDGIIIASGEGYPEKGIMLNIVRTGKIISIKEATVGEKIILSVVDKKGKPIEGAVVLIDGERYVTNSKGEVEYIPKTIGEKTIIATKAGYLIEKTKITIREREKEACYFPVFLGWFIILPHEHYVLWIITMLFSLIGILIIGKKLQWQITKRVIYYVAPVVLALPNFWIFTICIMTNIAILQFFIGIMLLFLKMKEKEENYSSTKKMEKYRAVEPKLNNKRKENEKK